MKYIDTNIRHLRELKDFSQEYFAEELKWTRAMVASFESGRTEPSIDKLIELSKYIKIPIDTLIKVDLRKSKNQTFIEIGNKRVLFPITVTEDNKEKIELIPIEASAGYLKGYADPEYIEDLQRFNLPFLPTGTHRAFPIKGDSMLPMKDGSFVVAKFVEELDDIVDGKTYVVLTKDDGLVYKRVYNRIKDLKGLLMYSDNKAYPPFKVKADDVLELWEYKCSINTQEYTQEELKLSSITNMLTQLQIELKSIKELTS